MYSLFVLSKKHYPYLTWYLRFLMQTLRKQNQWSMTICILPYQVWPSDYQSVSDNWMDEDGQYVILLQCFVY